MTHSSPADPHHTPDDPAFPIDVRHYWAIVTKRKWLVLATVSIIVTLTVLYTLRQPKVYAATAAVIVDPKAPSVFGSEVQEVVQLGTGNYWANIEYYNTQVAILGSFRLAEQAVRDHDLSSIDELVRADPDESLSEEKRIERAARSLSSAVSASLDNESRVIRIEVRHTNPRLAAKLANDIVTSYISSNLDVRTKSSKETSKFLSTELDTAERDLRESEERLLNFKRDNQVLSISLDDKVNLLAADLERYTAALSTARIERIELDALRKRARVAAGGEGDDVLESPVFALAKTIAVVNLKDQYIAEQQRLLELSEDLGPRNPAYVAQKKKVDDLYAGLRREARLAVREIEERYAAARDREVKFAAEVERLKAEALDLGPKKIEFNRLERRRDNDQKNYQIVIDRLRASQLTSKNQFGNITEHARATVPTTPVSPRMGLNVALATVLSLVLGLGLAFGIEFLDRTIKSGDDVEQAVGAPLLGPIPVVVQASAGDDLQVQRDRDLYVFNHPTSPAAECCRSIRTNILFSSADHQLKTITVSSPNPREGKTTSVIYLGTTMAQSGQRVLLIDTDMRRPRLHKSMGVARGVGVSNLIVGDADIDDVIKTTEIPNLYVLPCGPTPPNPAELLLTNRFREILDALGKRFDRILLDSPPLGAVTDAVVLGKLSDGIIMVAEAERTTRDHLSHAARQLRDVDARIIGVILNDLDMTSKKYGYYYYQYGYGYAEKSGAEAESSNA